MSKRQVPWYNQLEWKLIYSQLYSNDKTMQMQAIKRTKAWSSRGRVPHSIEITSLMVEIGLNMTMSETELRYIYSMAIIRFVNGIVDSGQKGVYASSAVGVAEQLGLPIWFVEQRHQATHDRIPSLPYLSKSRLAALEWLRTNYWHVQDTAHDDLKAVIVTKIKEYKALSLEKNYKQQRKLVEDITSLLSQDDFQELLVPVFIDEVLTVVQTLTTPEMISLHESSISNEIKSWKVFIDTCILDFPQFMVILFERLLTLKPSPTITEWIRYILTNTIFSKDDTLVLLKLCFENEKCNNVKDFLKIIMTFKSMPEEGHRYYILLDYLLGSTNSIKRSGDGVNKLDIDDEMLLDKVNKQIEIVKGKLESLDTPLPESNSKWVLVEGINCQVGEIEEDGDLDLDPSYDDLTWLNSNNMLFIPVLEKLEEARESSALGDDDVEIDQSKLIIY